MGKEKFVYKERDEKKIQERANQTGSSRDHFIQGGFTVFKPQKENRIRILPPTWSDPDHYGTDVWVHYTIGSDKSAYICPKQMKNEYCPICEEVDELRREGKTTEANKISAKRRVLVWLIDRAEENIGPKYWPMPWTLDREIVKQATEEDTKGWLPIDKPDKGYDIFFEKDGDKDRTEYVAVKVARRPSPISVNDADIDKWLDFIVDNPLPSILKTYETSYISKVFRGEFVTPTTDATQNAVDDDDPFAITEELVNSLDRDELDALALTNSVGLTRTQTRELSDDELRAEILATQKEEAQPSKHEEAPTKNDAASKLREKLAQKGIKK